MKKMFAIILVGLLTACSGGGDDPSKDTEPKSTDGTKSTKIEVPKLEATTVGSLPAFKAGNVYLAGQPSEEDLKQFAEAGGKTVISLRLPDEDVGFDEFNVVEQQLGMKFSNPGFRSPDTLRPEIFFAVRESLKNKNEQPLLLHCASANRVGAIWLAHRVLDGQLSYNDALNEAKQVGLKPQVFEAAVKQYIDSAKAEKPTE